MHLVKSFVSGLLLVASILWFGIQQIFTPQDFVSRLFIQHQLGEVDFIQLKRDWCRVRTKKIGWREMKQPCQEHIFQMNDRRYRTDPNLSQVSEIIVKAAGEFTRLRIDTYTSFGVPKNFGGDSYRVYFTGPNIVAGTVFDLKNGSYEALGLLLEPGFYTVKVILDYTQCNGLKDPPTEWYVKAHCSGRGNRTLVPHYVSAQLDDYLQTEISPGIRIKVSHQNYNLAKLPEITKKLDCGFQCNKVWDGHGVWKKSSRDRVWGWKNIVPLAEKFSKSRKLDLKSRTLWIYGDSISYYFFNRLKDQELCKGMFTTCKNTYNWIYPKKLYEMANFCEDLDVNIPKIRSYFRQVITDPQMDEKSVFIFNLGAHFVKNTSFRKYRRIIDACIQELQSYKGTVVWKSTTAIHLQNMEIMGAFRRYLTDQRVQLFNSYANAAICNAKYRLLDVYPITSSYPFGTKDGVHYHRNASQPVEFMLAEYFRGIQASLENTVGI